ncbi:MAG TPA: carboxypeptidase-like regulatory domain-containing protein, partial [Bacteroidota bacterium]
QGEGVRRYTAAVSVLPGELTAANNRRSFTARVLRSKLRVLVLAGQPSPDVPVIAQTLREEKNFSVLSFTENTQGGFYEGNLPRGVLDSADCLVLAGFPAAWTPPGLLQEIAARLAAGRAPLLFIAGKALDYRRAQAIGEALPFTVTQATPSEQLVSLQPSEDQQEHPVLNSGEGISAWNDLPPVYRRFALYTAKPGAVTLGTARIQRTPLHEPLLLARSLNRTKSVALLAYGIWRWRLMAQDAPGTAPLLSAFLVNAVKWLTTPDDRRPVRVAPTQESFSQGQPVELTGQVYNASAEPVDNAALKVVARQKDRSYETDLRSLGAGRYEGSLEGLPEGEYTFQAAATLNGASLGEDRGRFTVGELDLELQETRMNSLLLRQLAFRTGGLYFSPTGLARLDSALADRPYFASRTVVHASDTELWHWQWLLAGIIALFAAEWMIRKISGML